MNEKIVNLHQRVRGGERSRPQGKRKSHVSSAQFMINRQSAVPLHIQLKEQIRYAVMSGDFPPGSPLPSIRELTSQLGIHRNTVHRVYLELQAGGLLTSRPGKGVFVNDSLSNTIPVSEINAIDQLIEKMFSEANTLGVNPITLSKLAGQRAPGYDVRHPTVAFVECTAHQSQECARDLADQFGVEVSQFLLDDLREHPDSIADHFQHIITSLFHYDEVRELLEPLQRKVHAITYDLHPATRNLLRELPEDARLGFICHDANTEEVMGREVAAMVSNGIFSGCANLEFPKQALELISRVNTVILTEPATAFGIEHCTPDHELLELHFVLNPASVDKVSRSVLFQP